MPSQYVFLPWLRRGLSKHIKDDDPLTGTGTVSQRAAISVNVKIMADDVERATQGQVMELIGPGDIIGINKSTIVKTDPDPNTKNFEPNYFPYIEFYDEDFPWRYTPAKAANERRLRPWLSLIALEETEFERVRSRSAASNRVIKILADPLTNVFPPSSQIWAWSHVQVNDTTLIESELATPAIRNQKLAASLNNNPNLGVSRVMCPRNLKPTTRYFAFLVPSFETGRLAGLGKTKSEIDSVARFEPAWGGTSNGDLFPVYHEWTFETGADDFELLAKKIEPRDLTGTDIGKLWMDASDINYGELFDYKGNLEPGVTEREGSLPFEGALILPGALPPNLITRQGPLEKEFAAHFARLINLGVQYREKEKSELQWSIDALGNDEDDPLLVPPLYGKWYADAKGNKPVDPLQSGSWFSQLNLDPAKRVAAGLGAQVVRENQEEYMSRSWDQLTDYRRNLNRELHRLRFTQAVAMAVFKKHFVGKSGQVEGEQVANKVLALTHGILGRISSDVANTSIAATISGSMTDVAFVQPAYRRITRTGGPVMKRRLTTTTAFTNVVMSTNEFAIMNFVLQVDPPFQNFDAAKLAAINPTSYRTVLRLRPFIEPRPRGAEIRRPNWFGSAVTPNVFVNEAKFQGLLKDLFEKVLVKPKQTKPPILNTTLLAKNVIAKINPAVSFKNVYLTKIPTNAPPAIINDTEISANSFNPFFSDPTYEGLAKSDRELFIPNLDIIQPNSCVLLKANSAFIESFLAGMNHEMGSEYLWRGFPADLNATYFRQFWDVSDAVDDGTDRSDIKAIREWGLQVSLGRNSPLDRGDPLVFVIKAELVKQYPNLVVYAQEAVMNNGARVPKEGTVLSPIFFARLEPDYLFAGFQLTKDRVLGLDPNHSKDGWYFAIAERPGEMHFGLDENRPADPFATWDDLAWTDLGENIGYIDLDHDIPSGPADKGGLLWGKGESPVSTNPLAGTGDAAQMAKILQQKPVQIFIHASLLTK